MFLPRLHEHGVYGTDGVEIYGSEDLLRSVVIMESNRGQGYGAELCDSLEEYARTNGVETLYLLTTTAALFFPLFCGRLLIQPWLSEAESQSTF